MKKIAVVFGVAAVATFTGCKDPDYKGRVVTPQDEAKSIETTPAETTVTTTVTTTEVKTVDTKPIEVKTVETKTVETKPVDTKPAEPAYTIYIVQNGDFLAKISKRYNVTIKSIKELNGLKTDTIRVGQKLKLPGRVEVGAQTAPAAAKATTTARKGYAPYTGATKEYVVKNGDTLGAVAYGNGINIRQLKELNKLTSDTLKVGQKLKVPAEKVAKAEAAKQAVVATKKAEVEVKKAEAEAVKAEAEAVTAVAAAEVKAAEAEVKKAEAQVKEAEATPATTTYVVEEGDDLTRLAVDFGVTPAVIRELNNLGENDAIKPGQVLKLPAETQP